MGAKRTCLLGILFALPWNAASAPCQLSDSPTDVSVDFEAMELSEVVDTSSDQIRQLAIAAGREDHLPLFGYYTAVITYETRINSQVAHIASDSFCASPQSVKVVLVLSNRVIHLAEETKSNACLYSAAREHARLHAQADERALADHAAVLSISLRASLRNLPLTTAGSEKAAESQTAALITAQVERRLSVIEQLRKEANNLVDSPSELARLHAKCRAHNEGEL